MLFMATTTHEKFWNGKDAERKESERKVETEERERDVWKSYLRNGKEGREGWSEERKEGRELMEK